MGKKDKKKKTPEAKAAKAATQALKAEKTALKRLLKDGSAPPSAHDPSRPSPRANAILIPVDDHAILHGGGA